MIIKNASVYGKDFTPCLTDIEIENGTIKSVDKTDADGYDFSGCVVLPGFIDIHMHEDPVENGAIRQCIFPMMLRQGVTTAVGGNCGGNVYDPLDYLNLVDRDGAAVNVALFAGHEHFRIAAGAEDIYGGSTEEQRQVMAEIIREKLLWALDREIPHGTAVEITKFSERDNGIIDIDATIYCEKQSHKGIIIGKRGDMLKKISSMARVDCEKFMGTQVFLTTWVKVKENWRDSDFLVRNFGYRE